MARSPVCILHHHIGQPSPFELGLNVSTPREIFLEQIDWLAARFRFTDLDGLLTGGAGADSVLLTFDDAFRSVLDVARDVLHPRGIPAVYFINPGLVGTARLSLDSTLAWAAGKAGIETLCRAVGVPVRAGVGELIGTDMARLPPEARAEVQALVEDRFGPPDLSGIAPRLTTEEVGLLPSLGVEVANHTLSHVHCRALTQADMQSEIVGARDRLAAMTGRPVRAFSVPYGNEVDLTPALLELLRATGHQAIFLVQGRSNRVRPAHDIWYRTSVRALPARRLALEVRVKPLLRSVRKLVGG